MKAQKAGARKKCGNEDIGRCVEGDRLEEPGEELVAVRGRNLRDWLVSAG